MSRDIKFRAWWQADKPEYHRGIQTNPPKMLYDSWNGECLLFAHEKQPVVVMQYTGHKDSHGKEMYEGDVVKDKGNNKGNCFWNDDSSGFDIDFQIGELQSVADCANDVEVIGNIYENPELLEVK